MVRAYVERETQQTKAEWQRGCFFTALLLNASGKSYKRRIKWESLMPKFGKGGEKPKVEDLEKRQREAEESFRLHKKKFWMKIRGPSVDKPAIFGEDENNPLVKQIKEWKASMPDGVPLELAKFLDK